MTQRLKEFFDNAEACRSLAAQTSDPIRRGELLELAAKWTMLADEREKLLETQKRLAALP